MWYAQCSLYKSWVVLILEVDFVELSYAFSNRIFYLFFPSAIGMLNVSCLYFVFCLTFVHIADEATDEESFIFARLCLLCLALD